MSTDRIVLITGASSGIGLGLAQRYAATGAHVIMTGRSAERLEHARASIPNAWAVAGELSDPAERERLACSVSEKYGRLDVLVNNAGIQRRIDIASDKSSWADRQNEIDLLLAAPVHLVALFTSLLLAANEGGQIVNVTSGGAFVPQPFAPLYSAAKAALHSYTVNLRYAFSESATTVTELAPPAVATGLAGLAQAHGANVDEFCDAVFPLLENRCEYVGFGPTASPDFRIRRREDAELFLTAAQRFPVQRY